MSDPDLVFAAVREANPRPSGSGGPDGEWSPAELLAQIEARSDTMSTTQRERVELRPGGPQPRRGWLVAAAAFVAVLLVGLGVLALGRGSSPDVADTVPSPTEAPTTTTTSTTTTDAAPEVDPEALAYAERLVADLNAGDAAAAHARFPGDEELRVNADGPARSIRSLAGLLTWFEYAVAMDSTFELADCKTSFGVTTCEILRTSPLEAYAPLPQPIRYGVRLEAGVPAFTQFEPQPGEWTTSEYAFMNWLAANHREEAEMLYNSPELAASYQNMSDAALEAALKRQYVPLWIETQRSP